MDAASKNAKPDKLDKLDEIHESQGQTSQSLPNSTSIELTDLIQVRPSKSICDQDGDSGIVEVEQKQTESMDSRTIRMKNRLIREALDNNAAAGSRAALSIYHIPQRLRGAADNKTYFPQVVSLGPYHHGKKLLAGMESHKWRALDRIISRTKKGIDLYVDAVRALEESARCCYEGRIKLDSDKFIEMMVLDSCFVLEILQGADKGFSQLGYSTDDQIFTMQATTMHLIRRDMIMLENQIPLFVLDELYSIQDGNSDLKGVVSRLGRQFLDPLKPRYECSLETVTCASRLCCWWHEQNNTNDEIVDITTTEALLDQGKTNSVPMQPLDEPHLLDVFRRNLLGDPIVKKKQKGSPKTDKRLQQLVPCVTRLKEQGIEFKGRETDRFWDIEFKNGILEIPRILIHGGTKSLFLNLITYEQCCFDCNNEITSYVIFMDNLIDNPEDVSYLHHCGIIEHWLGSDAEVAELFNRICREVVFDRNDSYLSGLSQSVNDYQHHKWNVWKASLKHKYFSNPWAYISFFAASVLLLLTAVQSGFSVVDYVVRNPKSPLASLPPISPPPFP